MTDANPGGLPPSRARRRLLYAGAGLAAAGAGATLAWRRLQPAGGPPSDAMAAFWGMSFETPEGPALAMESFRRKHLLINFWATWCPPCVEELPLIESFYKENVAKNWQVLALAIDQPSAVRQFLSRIPVTFPVGLAGLNGTELGKSLGNLSGGLPFTVVVGTDGAVRQRRMGKVTAADLAAWSADS